MSKPDKEIEFKYDFNGLRTQKIVTENGVTTTTNYLLHGKLVTHMTVGNDNLHFFYDNSSRPAKVDFNGTTYTYLHNLQGDIVGILDSTGALVVEYKYDAWGKPLSTAGLLADTLGARSPFRYRGYVFDEESGLYYLRSRYYIPMVGRFVNADSMLNKFFAFSWQNLFTYCNNKPVSLGDCDGLQAYILLFAYFKTETCFDTGHSEVGYLIEAENDNDESELVVYSYGRYADESEATDLVGPGILMIYDDLSSWSYNVDRKGRAGIVVAFEATYQDIDAMRAYVGTKTAAGKKYDGSKTKSAKYSCQIEDYNILYSNCTTFAYDVIHAVYGKKIEGKLGRSFIPYFMWHNISDLIISKFSLVKWSYTTREDLIR